MASTKIQDGTQWGDWRLITGTMHLVFMEGDRELYAIPLESMINSAQVLDWIFQLREKTWATNDIVGLLEGPR
jgi:hypothetical protein